jgi:predicted transcriptional regulator
MQDTRAGPIMPLDEIAKRILVTLKDGPQSAEAIATLCGGGASRMTSPRLVWLEGLGLVESVGAGNFGITDLGVQFVQVIH